MNEIQDRIFNTIISIPNSAPKNRKSLFVDGDYYESMFAAGIDSDISYTWLCLMLKKSQGAPVRIKDKTVVTVEWIKRNPEYLMDPDDLL